MRKFGVVGLCRTAKAPEREGIIEATTFAPVPPGAPGLGASLRPAPRLRAALHLRATPVLSLRRRAGWHSQMARGRPTTSPARRIRPCAALATARCATDPAWRGRDARVESCCDSIPPGTLGAPGHPARAG